jgi:hypothetical protein
MTAFLGCKKTEINNNLRLGKTVILPINDSISFAVTDNDNLTISFEEVVSDTRIPVNICELAYGVFEAQIELSMLYKTKEFNIPFTINGCTNQDYDTYKDTLDFRFHIYRLEPFSKVEVQNYSDYKIKLKVEKL